jgi:O-antigen/teichoic acid export membrane protein
MKVNNIARNTSYFTTALILQKVISFTYFTLLARYLMPDDLGKYYFAISFTSIFIIFIDIGLSNVLTREIARDKEKAEEILNAGLAVKIPLAVIVFFVVHLAIKTLGYSEQVIQLVYFTSLCIILDTLSATFFAVMRGLHNLKYESIASIIYQATILISGAVFMSMGKSLEWLMSSLVAASTIYFISACL